MARNKRSPEELDSIAAELAAASTTLTTIASSMRENGMPDVLIHGSTTLNRDLPRVLQWVDKVNADAKAQLRAFLQGIPSVAETLKELNENKKLAAAKKPWPKKATKKKAT